VEEFAGVFEGCVCVSGEEGVVVVYALGVDIVDRTFGSSSGEVSEEYGGQDGMVGEDVSDGTGG